MKQAPAKRAASFQEALRTDPQYLSFLRAYESNRDSVLKVEKDRFAKEQEKRRVWTSFYEALKKCKGREEELCREYDVRR